MIYIPIKKLLKLMMSISAVLFISGCQDRQETALFLEVALNSNKESVKVDEPFKLIIAVQYGEKEISRDTIVEVEFIENGISPGSVNPSYLGKGKYELEMKFISEGEHMVVAHVEYEDYYETRFLSFLVTE